MSQKAQVTSIEAVEDFRAKLIVYQVSARAALEEVSSDMLRMRLWIENDQRNHWEKEIRKRGRALEEARQAVFSAQMSSLREVSAAEQLAERKAKHALDEAQNKLRVLRQWERQFSTRVEPLVKQTEKLLTVLTLDIPRGIAFLTEVTRLLQEYASLNRGGLGGPTTQPGESPLASGSDPDTAGAKEEAEGR